MSSSPAFHTTRWTLVRASSGSDTAAQQAMSDLCAAYYQPVVTFIQRSGFEEGRARDLAHDFFTRVLSSPEWLQPDRARGRFRSYLLGAVRHFVLNTLVHERAAKRGGDIEHTQLNDNDPAQELTPDRAFDRQWALTLLDRVVTTLAADYTGREAHFTLLKPWLMGDDDTLSQANIAAQLEMTQGAVKVAIHRLRKRFRDLLRAEITHTVSDEADARAELAHLLRAM
jgi:RNA polymerase sigma factor (sigma-70 family)